MKADEFMQFVDLVASMRATQQAYFKARSREVLINSKKLEAEVDLFVRPGVECRANSIHQQGSLAAPRHADRRTREKTLDSGGL
jgi:hypothetical protein